MKKKTKKPIKQEDEPAEQKKSHKKRSDKKERPAETHYKDHTVHRRHHERTHLEGDHPHDLFDFDDPMTDSDYDDLDEYTGIYHDEDPELHKSHHVKRHYTEEQYYHARDRYFPEDAYRAAG